MLHRVIDKKLRSASLKKSLVSSPFNEKTDYNSIFISSPKLPRRSSEIGESIISPLLRRTSIEINKQDFGSMLSNINSFVTNLDSKNRIIWELEDRLKSVAELIFGLYEKMKEFLLVDQVLIIKYFLF